MDGKDAGVEIGMDGKDAGVKIGMDGNEACPKIARFLRPVDLVEFDALVEFVEFRLLIVSESKSM